MKVPCDSLHAMMKEAVGHRRVEQRSNHTPVKGAVISLESFVRLEFRRYDAVVSSLKTKSQRSRVSVAAQETA